VGKIILVLISTTLFLDHDGSKAFLHITDGDLNMHIDQCIPCFRGGRSLLIGLGIMHDIHAMGRGGAQQTCLWRWPITNA
jgi:hypothetical protein